MSEYSDVDVKLDKPWNGWVEFQRYLRFKGDYKIRLFHKDGNQYQASTDDKAFLWQKMEWDEANAIIEEYLGELDE